MYDCPHVHVQDCTKDDMFGAIILFCSFRPVTLTMTTYPVFIPNDYLYANCKQEPNEEKYDTFGQAVREMIARETGLKLSNQTFREANQYWKFLDGLVKTYEVPDKKKN